MEIIKTFIVFTISTAKAQHWFAANDLATEPSVQSNNSNLAQETSFNYSNDVQYDNHQFTPIFVQLNRQKTPENLQFAQKGINKHLNNDMIEHSKTLQSYQTHEPNSSTLHNRELNNTKSTFNGIRRRKCPPLRANSKKFLRSKAGQKPRFLDVFHVVSIANVACAASSGLEGTCLHRYECESGGGVPMGDCADGYGVCCVRQYSCGDTTAATVAWFTNPGYPTPSAERLSCALTLDKASEDVLQIRLDLISFELLPPTEGSCEQDQFVVSGHNKNSMVPILCGVNNGQHLYVEVGDVPGPVYLSLQTVTEDARLFAIKVSQLTSTHELTAPAGCLQHYIGTQGVLESFNYQDKSSLLISKNPSYLNNLNYAICIQRAPEFCSITYTNSDEFQIPNYDSYGVPVIPAEQAGVEIFNCPADWLLTAAARLCGERLNDGSVLQDFSMDAPVTDSSAGPVVVWFHSDSGSVGRGFRLLYTQNACTEAHLGASDTPESSSLPV